MLKFLIYLAAALALAGLAAGGVTPRAVPANARSVFDPETGVTLWIDLRPTVDRDCRCRYVVRTGAVDCACAVVL